MKISFALLVLGFVLISNTSFAQDCGCSVQKGDCHIDACEFNLDEMNVTIVNNVEIWCYDAEGGHTVEYVSMRVVDCSYDTFWCPNYTYSCLAVANGNQEDNCVTDTCESPMGIDCPGGWSYPPPVGFDGKTVICCCQP